MLSVEDKIAIQELFARFAHCSDFCDWDGLPKVFTPDVVTEMEGIPIRYEGIPAQIEHARESAERTGGKNRHYYFNFVVTAEGDQVFVDYAFLNTNAGQAPMDAQIVTSGRHRDTVVKTAEGWKIARRSLQFDQKFELSF